MKKAFVLSILAAFAFTTLEGQIEVKTDGSVQAGADSHYSNDKDFTVTNVHQTGTKYAYSGFRMDNYNNYLHLNKKGSNYRNEIIWYSYDYARWHLGMDDSDDSQDNGSNLFIGQNIGGSNPYLWFDENEVIGMFTKNPDLSYRLTISGNTLSRYGYWQSSDATLKKM